MRCTPPCGPAGAAGGIGEPAAAAVRRKRRWPRPMGDLPSPHGLLPSAAANRAAQPRVDSGVDRSTQPHTTPYAKAIVTGSQNSSRLRVHSTTALLPPSPPTTNLNKMFNNQPVPLNKRGSARSRSRQNRIALRASAGPAANPGHPHGSSSVALPTTTPTPQGTTPPARL